MKNIILASASPRRKELLSLLNISFEVVKSDVEEVMEETIHPAQLVMKLAEQKATDVYSKFSDSVVIGADTIVTLNGQKLGKPETKEDAFRMLSLLSGNSHEVYTGVSIQIGGEITNFNVCTKVTFYQLTDEEIHTYIKTGEPMDKAGSYGIQGYGAIFVKEIEGDYYSVVGLPISQLARQLKRLNVI
jgi:septum formation protein